MPLYACRHAACSRNNVWGPWGHGAVGAKGGLGVNSMHGGTGDPAFVGLAGMAGHMARGGVCMPAEGRGNNDQLST